MTVQTGEEQFAIVQRLADSEETDGRVALWARVQLGRFREETRETEAALWRSYRASFGVDGYWRFWDRPQSVGGSRALEDAARWRSYRASLKCHALWRFGDRPHVERLPLAPLGARGAMWHYERLEYRAIDPMPWVLAHVDKRTGAGSLVPVPRELEAPRLAIPMPFGEWRRAAVAGDFETIDRYRATLVDFGQEFARWTEQAQVVGFVPLDAVLRPQFFLDWRFEAADFFAGWHLLACDPVIRKDFREVFEHFRPAAAVPVCDLCCDLVRSLGLEPVKTPGRSDEWA